MDLDKELESIVQKPVTFHGLIFLRVSARFFVLCKRRAQNISTMQYVMTVTMGGGGWGGKNKQNCVTQPVPVLTFLNNYSAASIALYKAIVMIDIYLHGE